MSHGSGATRLITRLTRAHERGSFDCGVPELNEWLQRFAMQNSGSGAARTYVQTLDGSEKTIIGYYSITPTEVHADDMPPALVKRAGRFPVPGFRLARLAIDQRWARKGFGGKLFFDAGVRAWKVSEEAAGQALFIDAKNEDLARWYERLGARQFPNDPLKLAIPLKIFKDLYLQMVEQDLRAAARGG
jgi:GNAT superfamily N-acetyltransferase